MAHANMAPRRRIVRGMVVPPVRVVIATPLGDDLHTLIQEREPRAHIIRDSSLLPPMRFAADFSGDPAFRRTPSQQRDFDELLDSADVLYGIPDISPEALSRTVAANPRLRWVQTMAAGGGAQIKAANLTPQQLARVVFTTSAGVHGQPLAEFAIFGLLAGAKDLPRLRQLQSDHSWVDRWTMGQLHSWTVLVLGGGGIAREVVRTLHTFGTRVVSTTRDRARAAIDGDSVHIDDVADILPRADGIVVALPGTDATHHLLDGRFFAAVKSGVTIVNVGRGTVIDEAALLTALDDGRVGFAVLDVFEHEPLAPSHPLWDRANVLVSPHTAALSVHEERLIAELFADNLRRYIDAERLANVVDTREFY
jgi:phosphoglycerate dehydrogenase-like enzyme